MPICIVYCIVYCFISLFIFYCLLYCLLFIVYCLFYYLLFVILFIVYLTVYFFVECQYCARCHNIFGIVGLGKFSDAQAIKSIMKALHRNCKSKTNRSNRLARRAVDAMHTRSLSDLPDPPVRIQAPRLRTEQAQYGFYNARFHCGAYTEIFHDGMRVELVASFLQESTLPFAGGGVIVQQLVPPNTTFLEYCGEFVRPSVAKARRAEVIRFISATAVWT